MAEHREIKRVCNRYAKRKEKGVENDVPNKFTLGEGHELFFSNKPKYTLSRYKDLHEECILRGFNVRDFSQNWEVYGDDCTLTYEQRVEDDITILDRIIDRVNESSKDKYGYYETKITREQYLINLNKYKDKLLAK